jgi:hypothetical protein
MRVLNFSNEIWESQYHGFSFEYNPRVWTLIPSSYDELDGMIFAVFDTKDGSSFILDMDKIEETGEFEFEHIADEYYSRLFNSDNACKRLGKYRLPLNDTEFHFELYSFNNNRFGKQIIARGAYVGAESVIGVAIAWPENYEVLPKYKVPPKFELFLDKLKVDDA